MADTCCRFHGLHDRGPHFVAVFEERNRGPHSSYSVHHHQRRPTKSIWVEATPKSVDRGTHLSKIATGGAALFVAMLGPARGTCGPAPTLWTLRELLS